MGKGKHITTMAVAFILLHGTLGAGQGMGVQREYRRIL